MTALQIREHSKSSGSLLRGTTSRRIGAVLLAALTSLPPLSARADQVQSGADFSPKTAAVERPSEVLARSFFGNTGIGLLGVGVEALYRVERKVAVGAAFDAFRVDNGADAAAYAPDGTLDKGYHGVALLQGNLFDSWLTPYARVGVGVGRHWRYRDHQYETVPEANATAELSAGVALRGGPFVGRVCAGPAIFGSDLFMAFGLTFGARF